MKRRVSELSPYRLTGQCTNVRAFDSERDCGGNPDVGNAVAALWMATFAFLGGIGNVQDKGAAVQLTAVGAIELPVDFRPKIGETYPLRLHVYRSFADDRFYSGEDAGQLG